MVHDSFSLFPYGSITQVLTKVVSKLPVRSEITAGKRNILLHSDQFRIVIVLLHEYLILSWQVFRLHSTKTYIFIAKNLIVISFPGF